MDEVPIPAAVLGDDRWEAIETVEEEFGGIVTVGSRRSLFGDVRLRECVAEATGQDRAWRSFFVSRMTTRPPLSAGIADLVVRTIAFPTARKRLVEDLESRGFRSIRERNTREMAVDSGAVARVAEFAATIPTDDDEVGGAAMLAIWDRETDLLVAGGTYPTEPPPGAADCFADADRYRRELLDLIRAVG